MAFKLAVPAAVLAGLVAGAILHHLWELRTTPAWFKERDLEVRALLDNLSSPDRDVVGYSLWKLGSMGPAAKSALPVLETADLGPNDEFDMYCGKSWADAVRKIKGIE